MAVSLEEILKLSVADRLELVTAIWDSIPDDAESMPLTAQEKAMLDERLAEIDANPDATIPWSEVRARLLNSQ